MEEFRILTPTQFREATDVCLKVLTDTTEKLEGDPHKKSALIHVVRTFCMDLEHTLFKED